MESSGLAMRSAVLFLAFASTLIGVPVLAASWVAFTRGADSCMHSGIARAGASSLLAFSVAIFIDLIVAVDAYDAYLPDLPALRLGLLTVGFLFLCCSIWLGYGVDVPGKAGLRVGWILSAAVAILGFGFIGFVVAHAGLRSLLEF